MYTAKLKDKIIQSFDVYNQYGEIIEEMDKTLRLAGSNRELTCLKCGGHVYFNHGKIKKPYFSHYKGEMVKGVDHHTSIQSGEHEEGVFILYQYFNRFYETLLDHRFPYKRNANVFIKADDKDMAIEFVYHPDSIKKRLTKMTDYKKHGQKSLWIISSQSAFVKDEHAFNLDERTFALEDKKDRIFILDTDTQMMTVRKYMEYFVGTDVAKRDKFSMKYHINQLVFDIEDGFQVPGFDQAFAKARKSFEEACKKLFKPKEKKTSIKIVEVKTTDVARNRLLATEKKQGKIKSSDIPMTCILCGREVKDYRQDLADGMCICTCVKHSDAVAIKGIRRLKKKCSSGSRKCIICGGGSDSNKYIIDDERCIGECISSERAKSIYETFNR